MPPPMVPPLVMPSPPAEDRQPGGNAMGAFPVLLGTLAEDLQPGAKARGARASPAYVWAEEEDPGFKPAHRSRCCWCPFTSSPIRRPGSVPRLAAVSPAATGRAKAEAWLTEEAATFARARQEKAQAALGAGARGGSWTRGGSPRGLLDARGLLEPCGGQQRRTKSWLFAKDGSLESIDSLQPLEEESLPPLEDSALLAALVARAARGP